MAAKFILKAAKGDQYHFNLEAINGEVILTSQLYQQRRGALNGIASVRKNAADDGRFERKANKNGEPYFALKAANGLVIGSSQSYSSAASMEKGIESVKKNAPEAEVVDETKVAV